MFETHFFETMLDNFSDGVYILDDAGNYIFVNSAYSKLLNMPKSVLLRYNVHDFLSTGQIDRCISDIVYLEKRQVVMFQDVWDTQNYGRSAIRQIVTSTPIFDEGGQVRNILAVVQPLDKLNDLYQQASQNSVVSSFSWSGTQHPASPSIVAESRTMRTVLDIAATVSQVDSAVLLLGESGTGKEVVANYIHSASTRSQKSLVVVNCASLPENLLEAELFGYEKGAFTGAAPGGKKGLFETAEGSTLFLDEINSMPLNLQGKVLRAIETKTVQRIGSTHTIPVDFRLITATNEDLAQLVEAKQFRADLYYRLNVIPIRLPPLRERREDIVPLANYFLAHFCQKYSKDKVFTPHTLEIFRAYLWPGNVRELRNVVERSVVMSMGRSIKSQIWLPSPAFPLKPRPPQKMSCQTAARPILLCPPPALRPCFRMEYPWSSIWNSVNGATSAIPFKNTTALIRPPKCWAPARPLSCAEKRNMGCNLFVPRTSQMRFYRTASDLFFVFDLRILHGSAFNSGKILACSLLLSFDATYSR